MATLEKRVEALEQVQPTNEHLKTLIVHFVTPGHLDAPIDHLRATGGGHWTRHDGESEQQFKDRAQREVRRNQRGVALLFANESACMEGDHAQP